MANTTKRLISDQVLMRLYGGPPDSAAPVQKYDIWKALEQKINAMFKMSQFTENLPNNETIPNNLALATYENIPVIASYSGKSKSTLPVMPITLPRTAGINEIRPILSINPEDSNLILGSPFIPLMAGQDFLLQADNLLNNLSGQIGYTPNGKIVEYTIDVTTLGITGVVMKLVVFDMAQYSETDILPVPSDMESQIVNELIAEFAPATAEPGIVNPITTLGQNSK